MKSIISFLLVLPLLISSESKDPTPKLKDKIEGAWKVINEDGTSTANEAVMTIADGYSFYSMYSIEKKQFMGSQGGLLSKKEDGTYEFLVEFNSWDANQVGKKLMINVSFSNNRMTTTIDGIGSQVYERIDDGQSEMFGSWRITDRMRNGEMTAMRQGSRKTIKMLTGTRFQWAAFDPASKSFSGTGGGTYTFKNGKYTETIEFHSRNPQRVGAVLPFDYKIEGKKWDHSGLSSTGNPIREIWTRQN